MKRETSKRPLYYEGNKDKAFGLVCEDYYELTENTIEVQKRKKLETAEYGISSAYCEDGTPFDDGPSGGADSPFTEVNSENQGVISEVPRKPPFIPEK